MYRAISRSGGTLSSGRATVKWVDPHHPKAVAWGPTQTPPAAPAPKYLFTSPVAPPRGGLDTMRSLDLRDKKKLRCIWLAPDEGMVAIAKGAQALKFSANSRYACVALQETSRLCDHHRWTACNMPK